MEKMGSCVRLESHMQFLWQILKAKTRSTETLVFSMQLSIFLDLILALAHKTACVIPAFGDILIALSRF